MKRFLIFSLFVLSACNTVTVPQPVTGASSSVLGLLHVSIDLRDEAHPRATTTFNPVGDRGRAYARAITGINDSVIRILPRQVEFLDDNESTAFGSKTRYVQATLEVANAGLTAFNNLNFIATSFPAGDPFATRLGTMFDVLNTANNVPIPDSATFPDGSNVFRRIKPTHGMRPALRGVAINPELADMQVYTRTGNVLTGEIDKVTADMATIYPTAQPLDFGFVVRNFSGGRTIVPTPSTCAFATDASCYKGQITVGIVMPRQLTRADTPFIFGFQFVVAEETDSIVTQSLEEQSDAKGSSRMQAFLQALPNVNPLINLLSGSGFYGASTLNKRTLCDVRTAQVAPGFASPELLTTAPGVKMETVAPAPNNMAVPTTSSVTASYCQIMNAATDTNLVIQAFQTGQRKAAGGTFNSGTFSASGSTLGYTPSANFKPGEEVEVSLSSGITRTADNVAIKPVVYRFRTATIPQSVAGFGTGTNVAAGTLPLSVVTGDFNKDGVLDLASANQTAGTVSVLLGIAQPTGGFSAAVPFSVGSAPTAITTGDFNNDGNLDLATANQTAGTISVLLGTGTGSFGPAVNYVVNSNPNAISTGDFNSDGRLDLVSTSDNAQGTVSVLFGTGAGVFSAVSSFQAGNNQAKVLTGDFNADGHLDLAVLLNRPTDPGLISILLGNGLGGFLTPVLRSVVAFNPTAMASADFNNDGRLDLVTANNDNSAPITVLLSNSAGEYATVLELQLNSTPTAITTGDVNGDGRLDIITANSSSNNISVLLGNGAGGFATAINYAAAAALNPDGVSTGDFNNDGRLDVVSANANSNNLSVFLKQ